MENPEAFEVLKIKVLPNLIEAAKTKRALRIWVPGCSTGEEAYSLAMIIKEYQEANKIKGLNVQIYATDLDRDAINVARQGIYPTNIAADVSSPRLHRFFVKTDDERYQIKKEVRETVVFAVQNIISDPPFTKIDLLSCRNLLIYLSPELQKRLLPLFHYSLNPGGVLFLGTSESIGIYTDLFQPLDNKWKVYRRYEAAITRDYLAGFPMTQPAHDVVSQSTRIESKASARVIMDLAEKAILENIAPPVVLINDKGDLLYLTQRTGKYLEPPVGKANLNIYAMAREGLKGEMGVAVRKAINEGSNVTVKDITVRTNGDLQTINLTVNPLKEPEPLRGLLMVTFQDVEKPHEKPVNLKKIAPASRLAIINRDLEKELSTTKQHLQNVVEDMQTSQEELKSANEELQSTNEELQSTNEELTTSREEMQSLNEELSTLNSELQAKNEELSETNNDLRNLLDSTQVPTLVLDNELRIKRFTPQITKIINLIHSDVGRSIADIVINLTNADLVKNAKEVLRTLNSKEIKVQSMGGNWYLMRIMPYRTIENVIDGLVVTFLEISDIKKMEESLDDLQEYADSIVSALHEPLVVLDKNLNVVLANGSFYKTFRLNRDEIIGKPIYAIGNRVLDRPEMHALLEDNLKKFDEVEGLKLDCDRKGKEHEAMLLNARRIRLSDDDHEQIIIAMNDVINSKEIEDEAAAVEKPQPG